MTVLEQNEDGGFELSDDLGTNPTVPDILEGIENPPHYPDLEILGGVPRFAGKTTNAVHRAAEEDGQKLILCQNHTLAHETIEDKLTTGEYAIGDRRIVHVQGQRRACPDCPHDPDQLDYPRVMSKVHNALDQHDVITPDVFSEVCPYYATKFAAGLARWVVTVPEMISRLDNQLNDPDIIIDEEDTMQYFFPRTSTVLKLKELDGDFVPQNYSIADEAFSRANTEWLRQKINEDIDRYERVPSRLPTALNGIDAFEDLKEGLQKNLDRLKSAEDLDEVDAILQGIEVPEAEIENHCESDFYSYLRMRFSMAESAQVIEPFYAQPRLQATKSGDEIHIRVVRNSLAETFIHRDLFENADNVWLIGDMFAQYFSAHFHPSPHLCHELLDDRIGEDHLRIIQLDHDNEHERRGHITKISERLTLQGRHNLTICGSSVRAAKVHDHIHPNSYFFRGASELSNYKDMSELGYNVTSYMGSRLTRGVDVDTQITAVRSSMFASPEWDYFDERDAQELQDMQDGMSEYQNLIEVHNAMLRGAGQSDDDGNPQKHIAIIPSISLYWGLDQYAETYESQEIEDVVERILQELEGVSDDLTCRDCGREFFALTALRDHECVADPTGIADRSTG